MKGLKGRFLKKLKLIPTINSLIKGFTLNTFCNQNPHSPPVYKDQDCKINPEPVIDSEDQKGKETDLGIDVGHQDTHKPTPKLEDQKVKETDLIIDVGHQNTNNPTPKIEIKEGHSRLPVSSHTIVKDETIPETVKIETADHPSLKDFEEKCPPGGEDSVVLYTTSLRGIRKTFKDCSCIRYLLSSLNILVHERDVSMDMEFREELWRLFGEQVVPPKLFIKGRYIGGADEVIGLHEEGKLKKLLKGIPSIHIPCRECANMLFLVCPNCDGSRKVFAQTEDNAELCLQCPDCNENGLVKCSVCS
ncbi:hypothetical protein HRI_004047800 [Hibiscus trionum]|uniref:Glutaredoxin domain-containing protein n=1 Tax=Hibiscus trionum TaxID=183268 RepID=A0A9W7IWA0_HIBTR|nr:hypothetical protein HRI_004047800 [Hibiscus trionum]